MRVYLGNCCYNRPFDPQTDLRIALETAAKMRVQALMRSGEVEYAWSAALDYELAAAGRNAPGKSDRFCNGGSRMTMIPDNVLRTECFQVLVDKFGYLDTERFVVMMSKSPMDYTTWHQRHFDNGESVRELGEKIKAFSARKYGVVSA